MKTLLLALILGTIQSASAEVINLVCGETEDMLNSSFTEYGENLSMVAESFISNGTDHDETGTLAVLQNPNNKSFSIFFIPDSDETTACLIALGRNIVTIDANTDD